MRAHMFTKLTVILTAECVDDIDNRRSRATGGFFHLELIFAFSEYIRFLLK